MKLFDALLDSAIKYPDRSAILHLDNYISYKELYFKSKTIADYISNLNLNSKSRVGILYENSIEYVFLYFAILGAGHVPVPLNTSLNPENLNFMLSDCSASALVIQSKFIKHLSILLSKNKSIKNVFTDSDIKSGFIGVNISSLQHIISESKVDNEQFEDIEKVVHDPADASDDLAVIFYTSGSTGKSKGVMLSHKNLLANTYSTIDYLKLQSDDSVLVILPFYYIYGNSLLLTHIVSGGTIVIDNRFMYPEVILKTLQEKKVTGFSGVPSNFMILLNKSTFAEQEFTHLRYFTQAGGSMAPEYIRKLSKAFPDKEIYIMYGQTEASPRISYLPPKKLKSKIGSIGIPILGVDIKIVDGDGVEVPDGESGELIVSGDNVMLGYWNHDAEESEIIRDGCLYTGDLARKDEDGYLYIIGRKKEIIKCGGNRVSVKEVEDRILEHKDVEEVAVFGIDDDILGEAIKAVIVTHGNVIISVDEIKLFCREKLVEFKIPNEIEFMEELPKHQSGKIDKVQLVTDSKNKKLNELKELNEIEENKKLIK